MYYLNFRLLCLLLVTCGFVACSSSDSEKPEVTPSKTDLLCNKKYRIISITVNPPIYITPDSAITSLWQNCYVDDRIEFKVDGRVLVDEGTKSCSAALPQKYEDRWSFSADEKQVIYRDKKTGKKINFKLETLDGKMLKATYVDTINTKAYNVTQILSK